MIPALNELRRTLGLPTMPTITGRRRASRLCHKKWAQRLQDGLSHGPAFRHSAMEFHRNLEACPDHLLGEPDADLRGRTVRIAGAVSRGFRCDPMTWLAFNRNVIGRLAFMRDGR